MRKNITYNITKKVRVENSPFKIGIYVFKDRNRILIEDLETGKAVEADSYLINNYIKLGKTETDWERSFDNTYIRFHEGRPEYFMSHYPEQNRYANLTIDIVKKMCPFFRNKEVMDPTTNRRIIMIDHEITPEKTEDKTYNYLFKNVKDFEVPNFKLEMVESSRSVVFNEDFTPIKIPQITCRVPLFQVFSILKPKIHIYEYEQKAYFDYHHNLTVMKMDNKFYRFPYGNTSDSDQICLGGYSVPRKNTQPDSIQDLSYAQIITTVFNGDYNPHVKFNNQIPTTFDINWIREKINKNDFEVSFMDVLFYISQCETLEEINKKLFILTPNVPKSILEFESRLFKILNPAKAEEASQESFTIGPEEVEPAGQEPARMDFRFVAPARETNRFRIPDEVTDLPRAGILRGRLTEPIRTEDGFPVPIQNNDGNLVTVHDMPGNTTTVNYNTYTTAATAWATGNQVYYDGTNFLTEHARAPRIVIMDDVEHPRTAVDVEAEQRAIQHQEAILRLRYETENNALEPAPEEYPDPRTTEEIYDDPVTERVIEQALHPQVSDHDRRLMEEIARSIELRRENTVLPTADEQGTREIGEVIGGIDLATNPHIQTFAPNPGTTTEFVGPNEIINIIPRLSDHDRLLMDEIATTLEQIIESAATQSVDLAANQDQMATTRMSMDEIRENIDNRLTIQPTNYSGLLTNLEQRSREHGITTDPFEEVPITINVARNTGEANDADRENVTENQRVQPS